MKRYPRLKAQYSAEAVGTDYIEHGRGDNFIYRLFKKKQAQMQKWKSEPCVRRKLLLWL